MNLRHIEIFYAVYRSGSISGAAKLLHVSQPSVSKTLKNAEDKLGFRLFERVRGKIVPTHEAHVLYNETYSIYKKIETVRRIANNLKGEMNNCLRLGVAPALGLSIIPRSVSSFIDNNASTKFEIETLHHEESINALAERRIDYALGFGSSPKPYLVSEELITGEFVCVLPNKKLLYNKQRLKLSDLQRYNFIMLNSRGPLGDILQTYIHQSSVKLNRIVDVETYYIAAKMASFGLGVTIVDEITAASYIDEKISYKKLDPPLYFNVYGMHLADVPLKHNMKKFISQVQYIVKTYTK